MGMSAGAELFWGAFLLEDYHPELDSSGVLDKYGEPVGLEEVVNGVQTGRFEWIYGDDDRPEFVLVSTGHHEYESHWLALRRSVVRVTDWTAEEVDDQGPALRRPTVQELERFCEVYARVREFLTRHDENVHEMLAEPYVRLWLGPTYG